MCEWFVGGTFGQVNNVGTNISNADVYGIASDMAPLFGTVDSASVDKLDFNMYTLQVGRSLTNANGWDIAAYLEVGWLDGDMTFKGSGTAGMTNVYNWSYSEKVDIDVVPVTINFKVEHAVYGPVSAYLTGGAGYAWSKVSGFGSDSTDGGFYGQLSAGLIYNINQQFEVFAGARWLYLQGVNMGDSDLELNNEFAWEVGLRYNF